VRFCFLAHGGSVNTRSWVEHFSDVLGHDVHVVSVDPVEPMSPSITVHDLSNGNGPSLRTRLAPYAANIGRVRTLVRKISPDLVIGYRVTSYGLLGAMAAFHPLAVVAQGQLYFRRLKHLPRKVLAQSVLARADLIHTWAPHMSKRAIELGAPPAKVLTCPRGIDLSRFTPRGGETGDAAQESEFTVVTTRSLHRCYFTDVIVRAVAMVSAERPDITAAILGEGEEEENLKTLADELGVNDRVRFGGRVAYDELPRILGRSTIYVSAIPLDGVSASLLEAMAKGCFPVVCDNAANRHWIEDGRNGFLAPHGQPERFAEAIARAMADPDLLRSAARMNRAIVEERGNLMKNMETIESAYVRLVEAFRLRGGRR
jgi:glycosyltransferase involved in cell wall biosynthesis